MAVIRTIWYRLEEGFIALLLTFMTLLTFIQVVLRYGFGSGILWGQEAVLYAFAWLVLFGLAYGIRTRAHLGIDIFVKMLAPPTRRIVGLVAITASALFAGLMLYGSYVYIDKLYEVGVEAQDLPIERWLLGVIMPIGFALLLVRLATEAWLILSGQASGFELADEAGDVLRDSEVAAPRE
ncbi:MAG: TRAP transporter small permease [Xanthobacteraceae bacterium]